MRHSHSAKRYDKGAKTNHMDTQRGIGSNMNRETHNPNLLGEAILATIKPLVKEAVQEAMNEHPAGPLLTPEELADCLKVPLSWVYEQSRLGNIPKHKFGRYIRFDLQEVIESQKKHQLSP